MPKKAAKKTKKTTTKKVVKVKKTAPVAVVDEVKKEETDTAKNHFVLTKSDDKTGKWYIIHTYSGHENSVAINLMQRVKTMKLDGKVLEILIPTQNKILIKRGKKTSIKEKIFPGYMLVKLVLDDETWLAVRTTPGVTGFVGIGSKPTPLPPTEVASIKRFMEQEAPKYKASFSLGEAVKIVEGPFADFLGTVDHIDEAKGKVHVLVSIFGRETPVELDFLQVAKI
jgi:transcription termination/antitermination protein NusG